MRHIVTLSLVFFSLTQLGRAERVEVLRVLNRQYCDKQLTSSVTTCFSQSNPDDPRYPFFLSYSELTSIGVAPQQSELGYRIYNQNIADLTVKETPKNNSP
ncbi:MAG: hypothetical protein H7223_04020 [Pedobacter sp.]|nr:hypothetical protein [Pedobacter sp.]